MDQMHPLSRHIPAQLWSPGLLSNLRASFSLSPNPFPSETFSCPSQVDVGSNSDPIVGEATLEGV